jgi:hypothetical protein
MAKRPPDGNQVDTINRNSPFNQMSFDLAKQDKFVTSLGVDFTHYKAMPSPLGKKDRGDHRRSDGVDTITSNGMIYRCAGKFTATITDNSRDTKKGDSGQLDPSQSKLVLPRFYNKDGIADGERIYLAPGDRVYISDPDADVLVSNYQEMDYMDGPNVPMFPIVRLDGPIVDSQNIEYVCGRDYKIDTNGDIVWIAGGRNPGMDPETGKGRIYSIRYMYRAYWYIVQIPKEIRISNVTAGNQRAPERMPMHAIIVREFIFHNRNRGDAQNQLKPQTEERTVPAPADSITPDKYAIPVQMSAFGDDGEQS